MCIKKNNKDACKSRLSEHISKKTPDYEILFKDVNRLLYLANSDEEVELAISGVLKLHEYEVNHEPENKFKLGSTLVRMLHNTKKIDRALDLYTNKVKVV